MSELNKEHYAIMDHANSRAAQGHYCGDSKEMQDLVSLGLMKSLGKKSFVPDEYFRITEAGKAELNKKFNKE